MTKHLVVVSDLHINSTVGLCSPEVRLDDGGTYRLSKSQKWLWENWKEFWRIASNLEGDIVTVLNGDSIDLNKHNSHQLITRNTAVVLKNAESVLGEAVNLSSSVYMVRGTSAHVNPSAELEEILGSNLGCIQSDGDMFSWWQLPIDVQGVLFDIAHHGRVGSTTWNRTGPLHQLAASITFEALRNEVRLPDVVIRSHNHLHADTHDNLPVRVIATPAWQLSTEYSYKLGIVEMADIGGIIFNCTDGQYTVQKVLFRPKAKQPIME